MTPRATWYASSPVAWLAQLDAKAAAWPPIWAGLYLVVKGASPASARLPCWRLGGSTGAVGHVRSLSQGLFRLRQERHENAMGHAVDVALAS